MKCLCEAHSVIMGKVRRDTTRGTYVHTTGSCYLIPRVAAKEPAR